MRSNKLHKIKRSEICCYARFLELIITEHEEFNL